MTSSVRMALLAAVFVPAIYFGAQLLAAPFYPGYSFNLQAASMLGSDRSLHPWIFNTGAVLTGVAALIGAYGMAVALRRRGVAVALCGAVVACLAVLGVTSIKAGMFSLPDPRHVSWQALTVFLVAMPLVFLLALWRQRDAGGMKVFLGMTVAAMIAMVPLMSGVVRVPGLENGATQRMFAATVFVPVGVVGWFLRRRS